MKLRLEQDQGGLRLVTEHGIPIENVEIVSVDISPIDMGVRTETVTMQMEIVYTGRGERK